MTIPCFKRLCEIIYDAGFSPIPYSGRAMYGSQCIAFASDDSTLYAAAYIAGSCDDETEAMGVLREAKEDSMGRGVVIYWPSVKWEGDLPEEEEE